MNMNRSSQQQAMVLRLSPFGEGHVMVDLLTPEEGVLPAMAYGLRSPRSSLRGKVVPFARGTVWLYRDPRRERAKITDFAVERYALTLQEDLTAFYHANLWAEVVWRTHASGDTGGEVYALLDQGLDLLAHPVDRLTREARSRQVGLGLLWRYLAILGVQPDLDVCVASEQPFAPGESRYYHRADGGLVGEAWAGPLMPRVSSGGVAFLRAAQDRGLAIVTARQLEEETIAEVRSFVLAAVQDAADRPLNTVAVAGGLL